MKRVQFVKGWLTGGTNPADGSVECGDYTDYPIEVTGADVRSRFDKIAEIYYRVKFAQFTSNDLIATAGVTTGSISPRVMWSDSGGGLSNNYLMSGYWTFDESPFSVYANAIPFLDDQYTENYWDIGGGETSGTFRDIGDREFGMWLPNGEGNEQPKWNKPDGSILDGGLTVNAFSWYSNSAAGTLTQPTIPIPWIYQIYLGDTIYEQLEISVQFSGEIAWVGESLYHPDTKFYLGMRIDGNNSFDGSVFTSWNAAYSATTSSYIMRLSTGDISCSLSADNISNYSGDLVHEAIEWFSYQDGNGNVWNPITGLRDQF